MKFIHIGHHKCGSTFIQYEVLPKIEDLHPMPFIDTGCITPFHKELMYLIRCDNLFFDIEKIRPAFQFPDFDCISYESFVGHGTMEARAGHQISQVAHRLHELFGETYILFIIRNQKTFIPSLYRDDLKFGYVCDFEDWFRRRLLFSQLNWCRFAPIIQQYQNIFGENKVKVVCFEDLFKTETLHDIFNSFGISSKGLEKVQFDRVLNPGLSPLAQTLTRLVNRSFGSKANMGKGRVYATWRQYGIPWANRLSARFGMHHKKLNFAGYDDLMRELYHEDNLTTSQLTGLDLHSKGYL